MEYRCTQLIKLPFQIWSWFHSYSGVASVWPTTAGNIWDELQPAENLLFHSGCRKVRLVPWCFRYRMRQWGYSSDWEGGTRLWRPQLINRVVLPGHEMQGGVTQYKTRQIQSSAAVGHFVLPDWSAAISCCTRNPSPAFIKPRDILVEKNRAQNPQCLKPSFH